MYVLHVMQCNVMCTVLDWNGMEWNGMECDVM